jgi:hypothetical protein
MDTLQRAALNRAKDALMFAFSEPMRLDLLAETGIDDVNSMLLVGHSPDERLQVLLPPCEAMRPDQMLALLLTCAQALIESVERREDA